MSARELPPAHAGHGWILAVAPLGAMRFRVTDHTVAETLQVAGAELVEHGAEVELARVRELSGDAATAAVDLGSSPSDAARRSHRIGGRIARAAAVAGSAPLVAAALRRHGYRVHIIPWDLGDPLRLQSLQPRPLTPVQHAPRRALVIGTRSEGPTMLAASIAAAQREVEGIEAAWPLVREGLLVMPSSTAVLRVGLGPARAEIDAQHAALGALRAARPARAVEERVPWPLARGSEALAVWLAERAVPGTQAGAIDGRLLDECVDFLTQLFRAGGGSWSAAPDALTLGRLVPDARDAARALAARIDANLHDLPSGFAHGDFWSGNVLVDGDGRLSGVIDWDAASPSRPPYLDLLHLLLVAERRPSATAWGPAVVEHLLPWARGGGDDASARYARSLGVEQSPDRLRTLAAAYWLNRAAFQLASWSDRARRPAWVDANVRLPLRAFASS